MPPSQVAVTSRFQLPNPRSQEANIGRSNSAFNFKPALLAVVTLTLFASCFLADAAAQTVFTTETCGAGGPQTLDPIRDAKKNLVVAGTCYIKGTLDPSGKTLPFVFHNVNVINSGQLIFQEGNPIDFWAESILIENKGSLTAVSSNAMVGYGSRLTIHLWGAPGNPDDPNDNVNVGIECQTKPTNDPSDPDGVGPCGIPNKLWSANPGMADHLMMANPTPPSHPKNKDCVHIGGYDVELPGKECFYQYEVQDLVDRKKGVKGYFGHKVLAVSFGGTLQLAGTKGSTFLTSKLKCTPTEPGNECNPSTTGTSWVRLTGVDKEMPILTLNGKVDWKKDDHIVVTTTDYLPGHSEEAVLARDAEKDYDDVTKTQKITLTAALKHPHNASVYALPPVDPTNGPSTEIGPQYDPNRDDVKHAVDTRAAVGLLTRNIQIVSEGDTPQPNSGKDNFPPDSGNYYGGHTIVRQGVALYQVQGVEFRQLGQGGAMGRYPVHFHMLRRTAQPVNSTDPPINYLKDCSINESMTRWVVLHATEGMYVARNVAYKSIGHGFYLEDATEIDNKLYANLGVMARAAVMNAQNPREVPGILADTSQARPAVAEVTPFRSDFDHPTVFWIMNGWNDFQYNFAAGAATCGVCYWWLPGANSGPSQYQHWDGYASQQIYDPADGTLANNLAAGGYSPLKNFVGNTCVAAMSSFQTVGGSNACNGVPAFGGADTDLVAVPTKAPVPPYGDLNTFNLYYPAVTGLHNATICANANQPATDCRVPPASVCDNPSADNCAATVIDRYTTSFNWAQTNFAAVWLRPKWYLVSNTAITDVQTGGLNFVTGGGYTRGDVPLGFWAVVRKSAFVGHSQPYTNGNFPANPFASDAGPINPMTPELVCGDTNSGYCVAKAEGISLQLPPFPGQRLFNIYDGPAFQEDNFYLDVNTTTTDCHPGETGRCDNSKYPLTRNLGVLKGGQECYLPNAAIAWKQPNGFYYPPAFNSRKLWFENVDIRHFVVEPLFMSDPQDPYNPFFQDQEKIKTRYCTYNTDTFNTFNHIDRQTVLNDDDGSLTGLLGEQDSVTRATISVNQDPYFQSPLITPECLSDKGVTPLNPNNRTFTAYTSPYEWLSTAITAQCAQPIPPTTPNKAQCLDDKLVIHWAHECTMPNCRGVPLYREYLTNEEEKVGTRPQIRMMGLDKAQRSTLTLNHGAYYIDTTQNCTSQAPGGCSTCQPNPKDPNDCFVTGNWRQTIFQGGQTYYVFFIYAKTSMHQTYDIYVGPGLEDQLKVTPVRANIPGGYEFRDVDNGKWVTTTPKPDQVPGVVRVTVDLSGETTVFDDSKPRFCQPKSFCELKPSGACGCATGNKQCPDDAVCAWGSHELDCPMDTDPEHPNRMGCYGFSFTMPGGPNGFHAPDLPIPPPTKLFVNYTKEPNKYFEVDNVTFSKNVAKSGGACDYPMVPTQR